MSLTQDKSQNEIFDISTLFSAGFEHAWLAYKKRERQRLNLAKKSQQASDKKASEHLDGHVNVSQKRKKERLAPTHFLALQIKSHEIINVANAIYTEVLDKQPNFKPIIISPSKFHITLGVLHLSNEDDIDRAKNILRIFENHEACPAVFELRLEGIGHFRNQVVFMKVLKEHVGFGELLKCQEYFSSVSWHSDVHNRQLLLNDQDVFQPHVTLLKLSKAKPRLVKELKRRINLQPFEKHLQCQFGAAIISEVQLCAMKHCAKSDYYPVVARAKLKDRDQATVGGQCAGFDQFAEQCSSETISRAINEVCASVNVAGHLSQQVLADCFKELCATNAEHSQPPSAHQ